ncbi:ORF3 [Crustacea hepe-like virus 1]|nr:ORF3 [Crustacea hepe-like virus 1]
MTQCQDFAATLIGTPSAPSNYIIAARKKSHLVATKVTAQHHSVQQQSIVTFSTGAHVHPVWAYGTTQQAANQPLTLPKPNG